MWRLSCLSCIALKSSCDDKELQWGDTMLSKMNTKQFHATSFCSLREWTEHKISLCHLVNTKMASFRKVLWAERSADNVKKTFFWLLIRAKHMITNSHDALQESDRVQPIVTAALYISTAYDKRMHWTLFVMAGLKRIWGLNTLWQQFKDKWWMDP